MERGTVSDVAAAVEWAVLHDEQGGHVIELGGPRNLTFNEFAASLQLAGGEPETVRHVPLRALRIAALFSLQAGEAVAMDTLDMTFTADGSRSAQPLTDPLDALKRHAQPAESQLKSEAQRGI